MTSRNRLLTLVLVGCGLLITPPTTKEARAQPLLGASTTIGQFIQGLEELVNTIENAAQNLLQQGNTALAQQQMLAAGILRQFLFEFRDSYRDSLAVTFEKISNTQSNIEGDTRKMLAAVHDLEKGTASDVQKAVYQLQGAANQIIKTLPFTSHAPVFYGMMVHDIYSELPQKGYDLELLGFNWIDSDLKKSPLVKVSDEVVPGSNLSIQEDRIQISLPTSIRNKIGYTNDRCARRGSFAASVEAFYNTKKQYLIFSTKTETSAAYRAFALASPETLTAKVKTVATQKAQTDIAQTFSVKSGQVTVGCESNQSGGARFVAPDGAKEMNCTAAWVDVSNIKDRTASCAVGGTVATASGTLRGRDLDCSVQTVLTGGLLGQIAGRKNVCNCRGGGHAWLELSGTYKISQTSETPFPSDVLTYQFLHDVNASLPAGSGKTIRRIDTEIARTGCDRVLDTITMHLPEETTRVATQSSEKGLFKAEYRSETLYIEKRE